MENVGNATKNPVAFALSLGVLGGSALIVTVWTSRRGPLVLLPYAALVIVAAIYLRAERVSGFMRRFSLTFTVFMIATAAVYIFVGTVTAKTLFTISLWGHLWRLGLVSVIGGVLSAATAQLTSTQDVA